MVGVRSSAAQQSRQVGDGAAGCPALEWVSTLRTRYKPVSTMRCTPGDYPHYFLEFTTRRTPVASPVPRVYNECVLCRPCAVAVKKQRRTEFMSNFYEISRYLWRPCFLTANYVPQLSYATRTADSRITVLQALLI